jgi:adenylate cyclase
MRELIPPDSRLRVSFSPVIAGVIGAQRLQFDLWGETGNLASRMESSGVAGRI